jgi:hypothetical protein
VEGGEQRLERTDLLAHADIEVEGNAGWEA